jgi:hypothetical protein
MSKKRKVVIILLAVILLIAILLQSWNVDNLGLGNNKWFDNGINIVLAITVLLAVSTTPTKPN